MYENCISQNGTGAGEVNVWGGGGGRPLHKYYGKTSEMERKEISKKFSIS